MKRSDIRSVYDQMTPTREQKDRMLYALLKEEKFLKEKKTGKYQSASAKNHRWNWIPAAAALVFVLMTGIHVLGRMNSEDLPAQVTAPAEAIENSDYNAYASVLAQYRQAIQEGWSVEQCIQANISFRFAASAEYAKNNAGYCLVDLDENGMNELIVGHISAGDLNIWDIWSIDSDGVPVSIATTADYGTTICLYEGNIIGTDTSTKDHGDTGFYTWDMDTGLQMLDGITSDGSNYYDVVDQKNISAEDAMYIIMGKYEMICPELTYLMEVPDYLREGSESMEIYEQTLEKYKTALQEKWSLARCAEEGISILTANFANNPTQVGYTILDLDGDSRDELLITDGNVILDMYALRTGMVTQIFSGWERSVYYLTDGLGIYHHGSNGAANTLYNYYRYSSGSLVLEEAVIFDAAADPEHPWFHQTPEGEITPVSEEAALEIMQYRCTAEIVFTPFTSDPQP